MDFEEGLLIIAIVTLQDFQLYVIMTYRLAGIKETNRVVEGAKAVSLQIYTCNTVAKIWRATKWCL